MKLAYKINHLFLLVIKKAPRFFSRRLNLVSEDYFYRDSKECNSEGTLTTSLFNPSLNWHAKGVHLLIRVNSKDVKKIQRWQTKNDPLNLNEMYKVKVSSEYDSWHNRGGFSPTNRNTKTYGDIKLNVESNYFDFCSCYLFSMSRGVVFLSLYLHCKKEATIALKDIDCSNLKNEKIYYSLNPFSKNYGCHSHNRAYRQGFKLLEKNLHNIYKDAIKLGSEVVHCLGLTRKVALAPITGFDFWLDDSRGYKIRCNEAKSKEHQFVIDDAVLNLSTKLPSEQEEIFEFLPSILKSKFSNIYLKSEDTEQSKSNIFRYKDRSCHSGESHNILSYLLYLNRKYGLINKNHERILTKKTSTNRRYDDFYNLSLEVKEMKSTLNAISSNCKDIFQFEGLEEYSPLVKNKIKYLKSKTDAYEAEIEKEKMILNELIQSENLSYHKKYSILIFVLVIVQIIIGLLTIDWEKVLSWL